MVGSFLNVCVCRMPKGESIVRPRSRCPKCGNSIVWYDNIPMVSWLMLSAKCRHCDKPISWQYPLVEAITGTLFLLVYLRFGMTIAAPVYMVMSASMVLVTFIDLTDWTIPNEVTIPGIPLGIVCALVGMYYPQSALRVTSIFDSLIGVVVGGGSLYLMDKGALLFLKKRGMGFGDVKLLAMLGAFFGWQGDIVIIMVASILGCFVHGTVIILAKKKRSVPKLNEDDEDEEELVGNYLPFGPYLAVAGLIVMFYETEPFFALYGIQ